LQIKLTQQHQLAVKQILNLLKLLELQEILKKKALNQRIMLRSARLLKQLILSVVQRLQEPALTI